MPWREKRRGRPKEEKGPVVCLMSPLFPVHPILRPGADKGRKPARKKEKKERREDQSPSGNTSGSHCESSLCVFPPTGSRPPGGEGGKKGAQRKEKGGERGRGGRLGMIGMAAHALSLLCSSNRLIRPRDGRKREAQQEKCRHWFERFFGPRRQRKRERNRGKKKKERARNRAWSRPHASRNHPQNKGKGGEKEKDAIRVGNRKLSSYLDIFATRRGKRAHEGRRKGRKNRSRPSFPSHRTFRRAGAEGLEGKP